MIIWLAIGVLTILGGAMAVRNKRFAMREYILPSKKTKQHNRFYYYFEGKYAVILGYFFILTGIAIIIATLS